MAATLDLEAWRAGWRPCWLSGPTLQWRRINLEFPQAPFFGMDLEEQLRGAACMLFPVETGWDALLNFPNRPPHGLIFHLSRCGSTLLSQALARVPGAAGPQRVLSEPEMVQRLLDFSQGQPEANRVAWLKGLVSALSSSQAAPLVIKLDPRALLDLQLFEQAFPETPRLFLHRDPLEILVSQLRSPAGSWLRESEQQAAFLVHQLGDWVKAARKAVLPMLWLGYRDLNAETLLKMAAHFGIHYASPQSEQLKLLAGFDAKSPSHKFSPDHIEKQASQEAKGLMQSFSAEIKVLRELLEEGPAFKEKGVQQSAKESF